MDTMNHILVTGGAGFIGSNSIHFMLDRQPATRITNLDIIHTICSILDRKMPDSPFKPHENLITFIKDRPGHDRRYAMDIRKIHSELGWSPRESLQTGLEKTVDWYLTHKSWVDNISARPDFKSWIDGHYSNPSGGTRP